MTGQPAALKVTAGRTSYKPIPRWMTCQACGCMWTSHREDECWACGSQGRPSRSPAIGSQHGFGTNDIGPRPENVES